jgi:hypothetical protein
MQVKSTGASLLLHDFTISGALLPRILSTEGSPLRGHLHDHLTVSTQQALFTRRSYGRGKVQDFQARLVRQQMKLDEDSWVALLACPLDREGYVEILRTKGLL